MNVNAKKLIIDAATEKKSPFFTQPLELGLMLSLGSRPTVQRNARKVEGQIGEVEGYPERPIEHDGIEDLGFLPVFGGTYNTSACLRWLYGMGSYPTRPV